MKFKIKLKPGKENTMRQFIIIILAMLSMHVVCAVEFHVMEKPEDMPDWAYRPGSHVVWSCKGDADTPPFEIRAFLKTCRASFFSLMTPVIILGSIYSGYATPVEASVVAIMYALFVGIVVNRLLRIKHLYTALLEGVMTCGTVLIIVGSSTLFGKILTYEQAPLMLANMIFKFTHNPTVVLVLIICLLYLLGMFMETLSTLIILVPVLLPVIVQLGIDPIHFGVILVLTNETALLTPPLGVNIFVSSRIAGIPVERNAVAVLPYVATLTFCVLTITFFPAIATWLPKVLGYGV